MEPTTLDITQVAVYATAAVAIISEVVALIPGDKVKSNSVLQLIVNILKRIGGKKDNV